MYDHTFGYRIPAWRCTAPGCGAEIGYSPLDDNWFHIEFSPLNASHLGSPRYPPPHLYGVPPAGVQPGDPVCLEDCDPDCECGPEHCFWLHLPAHKPGWHSPEDCPLSRVEAAEDESEVA